VGESERGRINVQSRHITGGRSVQAIKPNKQRQNSDGQNVKVKHQTISLIFDIYPLRYCKLKTDLTDETDDEYNYGKLQRFLGEMCARIYNKNCFCFFCQKSPNWNSNQKKFIFYTVSLCFSCITYLLLLH